MNPIPPHLFIDTNVWFSAFYGSKNCEALIRAHIEGKIVAVISRQVLTEIVQNIQEKIPRALPALKRLIASTPPLMILDPKEIDPKIKKLVHPKDQMVFCSILGVEKVTYFVTGNTKDFSLPELEKLTGIKVLTPKQAVEELGL